MKKFLIEYAIKQFENKEFIDEWSMAIAILIVTKIFTMIVSMWSAMNYFEYLLQPFFISTFKTLFVTIFVLIVIEMFTNISISKFWKFALKGSLLQATATFIVSVCLFYISFYTSCEGLSLNRKQQIDKTIEIKNKYYNYLQELEKIKDNDIKKLENEIYVIKQNPEGWESGSRKYLTLEQQNSIHIYNVSVKKLKDDFEVKKNENEKKLAVELKQNESKKEDEGKKYYSIVAFIMFFQMLINGGLMFFWSRIYLSKNESETLINFNVDKKKFIDTYVNVLKKEIEKTETLILDKLNNKNVSKNEKKSDTDAVSDKSSEVKNVLKIVENDSKTIDNSIENEKNDSENFLETEKNVRKNQKFCEFCGKTFELTRKDRRFCDKKCRISYHNNKNFQNPVPISLAN